VAVSVLVVGSGAREHALAWKLAQSPRIGTLYVAPGNGGTASIAENVPIPASDVAALLRFARRNVGLTVVGPDEPLALGIVDRFRAASLQIFGPTRAASRIEWSKGFAKRLMRTAGVRTPPFRVFRSRDTARRFIERYGVPIVLKKDGLAQGKGVYVCYSPLDLDPAFRKLFKERGDVVVESFEPGDELSWHGLCDGVTIRMFPPSQDYKTLYEGGEGPNTGGMGAIAPVPDTTEAEVRFAEQAIFARTLAALWNIGTPFTGCLYPGTVRTGNELSVLEYNARFGDPETQVYLRLLKTDLLDLLEACVNESLSGQAVEWNPGFAICVVLASEGYPETSRTGVPITGIEDAEAIPGVTVFHAGTSHTGILRTAGGRVLSVTVTARTVSDAVETIYTAVSRIRFEGMHFRTDIARSFLSPTPSY
jgi:phosphoribosylamine--glycine ligase